jgi:charged multivesicular body protein 5
MNRIFGSSKPAAPKATLNDAISKTDERVDSVHVKVRKLDAELLRYKEQMASMR